MNRVMTFERLRARAGKLPPLTADLLVAAGVGLFTASDAAVNDPEYRQADWFTWLLLAVSLLALVRRRREPVAVAVITGAACAGWALYGHIGELLNLPVIVALYTVAVLGGRRRTVWTGAVAPVVSGAVALRWGAAGFLLKDIEPEELRAAIRTVAAGQSLLAPAVTRSVVEEFVRLRVPEALGAERLGQLTDREREVMALVAAGLTNAEISTELIMSPLTAKTHVSRAMIKLGARDRAQLVVLAYETGLVRAGSADARARGAALRRRE